MPYGRPGAHWALLDGESIALRRSTFDIAKAIDDIGRDSAFPQARAWAEHFLTARATDADAMAVFR